MSKDLFKWSKYIARCLPKRLRNALPGAFFVSAKLSRRGWEPMPTIEKAGGIVVEAKKVTKPRTFGLK